MGRAVGGAVVAAAAAAPFAVAATTGRGARPPADFDGSIMRNSSQDAPRIIDKLHSCNGGAGEGASGAALALAGACAAAGPGAAARPATAEGLAESLGRLLMPTLDHSGREELVTALWAWGQLAADGAFSPTMLSQFEAALQAFRLQYLFDAKPLEAAMVLGAMAFLAQAGHHIADQGLEAAVLAGALERYHAAAFPSGGGFGGGGGEHHLFADNRSPSDVGADGMLADILWALAVLWEPRRRPPSRHWDLLGAMAVRAAELDYLEGASLKAVGKVLWALARLQWSGPSPLLPAHGREWRRLAEAFLARASKAASAGARDEAALELFTEALGRLSSDNGACGAPGAERCLSDREARAYLKRACFSIG